MLIFRIIVNIWSMRTSHWEVKVRNDGTRIIIRNVMCTHLNRWSRFYLLQLSYSQFHRYKNSLLSYFITSDSHNFTLKSICKVSFLRFHDFTTSRFCIFYIVFTIPDDMSKWHSLWIVWNSLSIFFFYACLCSTMSIRAYITNSGGGKVVNVSLFSFIHMTHVVFIVTIPLNQP